MKILVTGKRGQVARCLADRSADYTDLSLFFAARNEADVFLDMEDEASIRMAVSKTNPDIIINAAAYTAVDQAEDEPELAMAINGIAPGILAEEVEKIGAIIIHISTDYVFDGELDRPYLPSDPVNPMSIYGKTKLAGEYAVRTATRRYIIVRTAWVYSPYGKNFYKTMLRLAETRDEVTVVDDQIGNPTSAYEIADGILCLCQALKNGDGSALETIRHLAGKEEMTWCGFADKIFAENNLECKARPVTTADYPTKAARPKNSRLSMI